MLAAKKLYTGNKHQVNPEIIIIKSLCTPNVCLDSVTGDLEKVTELISGLAPGPEEESPYEALFEATSCHSLDSLTSGKSSDRDSGRPDSEAGKVSRSLTKTESSKNIFVTEMKSRTPTRGG